jgi:hypothetical protein
MKADRTAWERRVAAGLWLLLAFVLWNALFDYGVRRAARDYLNQRQQYVDGLGSPVTIDAVMRPAISRSAWTASAWSVGVCGVGLAATAWFAGRPTSEGGSQFRRP